MFQPDVLGHNIESKLCELPSGGGMPKQGFDSPITLDNASAWTDMDLEYTSWSAWSSEHIPIFSWARAWDWRPLKETTPQK